MSSFRVVVLASGSGTNLQAILDQLHGHDLVEVVGVGSDKAEAGALERGRRAGVDTAIFAAAEFVDRAARDEAIGDWIESLAADLVVLAGYMQLLSPAFVARFRNRVVNIHPALLPSFPGLDAIGQALAAGVETTGVTVHFVDEGVDTGPVIAQREVPVPAGMRREELEAAVHAVEHELYPEAIRIIAEGRVRIDPSDPRKVAINHPMNSEPATDTQQESLGDGQVRVRRALVSVSDKTGIADFAKGLAALGVEILSTGGTATALREAGIEVVDVSEFTGQEEILGGRVKTLHPRLHAALLARRGDPEHVATLEREGIEPIDLVCVNLYPFEQTVAAADVTHDVAIENIDIGGPTMIRAAAKNHESVAVIVKPESYDAVLAELEESGGEVSAATRHWLANEAFAQTARYDAAISRWFSMEYEDFPEHLAVAYEKVLDLSYGENPHQRAALYSESGLRTHILSRTSKLHGRALSFNNVLDLDSARSLVDDFEQPACVIVKHNNPCGVAIGADALEAYLKALACDPVSAYGGVIALNRPIGRELAEKLHENFVEVLSAPGYEDGALDVLTQKEAIRILCEEERREADPRERDVKRVEGGLLIQDRDGEPEPREIMEAVTGNQPSEEQWRDMLFAWTVSRRVRSNAIVIAKGGATLGIGAGQMSRVDSVRLAVEKCREARGPEADSLLSGSALASDAFFPFADGPELAIQAGTTAVIQPGGSKRDGEVIEACEGAGVAMVFTKHRHFRH
ncbi:MAG TPA: bifunctional phosphoribosylaminoimidazolecarboxamide formyltransferase/IMP cyclohydrolase [Solirubrobacterales bacterium]|nr:bifunctional phosphoribosylaminoimidazolecarboxamide formyltransferase/IMP cyclohydrolase [Solirubrobacterales bacterium]